MGSSTRRSVLLGHHKGSDLESLNGGVPLSVTFTTIMLVPGPWISVGTHVSVPASGAIRTPGGASGPRLNRS